MGRELLDVVLKASPVGFPLGQPKSPVRTFVKSWYPHPRDVASVEQG